MSQCPGCGRALRAGASFCGGCGARLSAGAYPAPAVRPQGVPPYAGYAPVAVAAPIAVTPLVAAAAAGQLVSWNGQPLSPTFANKKAIAGILAIFFGQWGVHKFILGYVGAGIAMLAISLVSYLLILTVLLSLLGIPALFAMGVFGLIEGIIYLTRSDEEFIQRYGLNRQSWF